MFIFRRFFDAIPSAPVDFWTSEQSPPQARRSHPGDRPETPETANVANVANVQKGQYDVHGKSWNHTDIQMNTNEYKRHITDIP